MEKEPRKRLEEAAEKYADEFAVGDAAIIVDLVHNVAENCFIAGGEFMFNECGGETVLKEMRQMILGQCKEWLKDYLVNYDDVNEHDFITDFEADINKLWEGEKNVSK